MPNSQDTENRALSQTESAEMGKRWEDWAKEDNRSATQHAAINAMLVQRARIANDNAQRAKIWSPTGYSACNKLMAFSTETDPKGLNIRDKPNGAVIGTVPTLVTSGGLTGTAGPLFTILGSQDGWFHVESIGVDEQIAERKVAPGYLGKGWVLGRKIGFNIQSEIGFEKPHKIADSLRFDPGNDRIKAGTNVVADLMGQSRSEKIKIVAAVGCHEDWVLVELSIAPLEKPKESRSRRAWFRGICDIVETSCDGLASDS